MCSPKIILCFLVVPQGKAYMCPFMLAFFLQSTSFCNTFLLVAAISGCIQLKLSQCDQENQIHMAESEEEVMRIVTSG